MARTFINQSNQIASSESYVSDLPLGVTLTTPTEQNANIQWDLNALRSLIFAAVGGSEWYEAPATSIGLLNSGLISAQSSITSLDASVASIDASIVSINGSIATLNTSVGQLQVDLDAVEAWQVTATGQISALETLTQAQAVSIAALQGDVTDLEAFQATATQQISGLEAFQATATQQIAGLETLTQDQGASIAALQVDVSDLETLTQNQGTAIVSLQGDVTDLETWQATATGQISALDAQVAADGQAIAGLQTDLTSLTSTVTLQGNAISTIETSLSDLSNTVTLQGNSISVLETTVASQGTSINTLNSQVAADGQAITALQSGLAASDANIASLQAWQTTASGEISALQSGLSSEIANRESADLALQGQITALDGAVIKKDGSVAFTGNQSMGGNLLTNLGSPASALDAANKAYVDSVAQGLKILAPVDAKYNFQGGVQPSVPSLPTEPASSTYLGTIYTVTTEAEFDSALGQCIDGDQIFVPTNVTITLTSVKTINKSIRIFGGKQTSSVFSASFAVPANSGLFVISGKKADGVTQNNAVTFSSLTITSSSNAADHACVTASTLSTAFPNGSLGIRFQECTFNHTEFGVTIAADSWVVKDCTFNYIPASGAADTSRHLGIYNIGTMGWVENCSFPATTEATPRTIAMLLTASDYDFTPGATKSGGFSGDFVVKGCSQLSGNLRQWMVMEVFKANGLNSAPMAEHGFNFWAINNTHGNTSGGSFNFYEGSGTKAPLNFFGTMYTSGNSIGSTTGTAKGMLAIDGLGSVRSAGAPTSFYVDVANSGAVFSQALGGAYVQGSATDNLLAINSTFYNSPNPNALVTILAPTSGGPVVPSGTGVNVGGYVAQSGDRIFVVNSFSAVESGIYVCDAGDWPRAADFADGADVASTFFFVSQGDSADTSWVEVGDPAIVGTNDLIFAQFSGAGTYTGSGAINVSAQNVISVIEGGITTSMLADGSVTPEKLSFDAATEQELIDGLALKLSLSGGVMSANSSISFAGDSGSILGLADLSANSDLSAAANKRYVDDAVAGIDSRTSKTYALVLSEVQAGTPLVGGPNGNLDAELPVMPSDPAELSANFDIYLNGQLLQSGAGNDVERGVNAQSLVFSFPVVAGDKLCVVQYA